MSENQRVSLGMVGLLFVSGAVLGAGVALLLAPQSGRESRDHLRRYARRAEDQVHKLAGEATEVLDKAVDQGRTFIQETRSVLAEAVEVGRDTMRREQEKLSGERRT